MAKSPDGFVSLTSLKKGAPGADAALAEIRRIYFKTTRQTIDHDLAHAIALLKSLGSEEQRERATVYMEGLAQMQKDWERRASGKGGRSGSTGKSVGSERSAGSGSSGKSGRRRKN